MGWRMKTKSVPDLVTEIDVRLRDIRLALGQNQIVFADRSAHAAQNLIYQLSELLLTKPE